MAMLQVVRDDWPEAAPPSLRVMSPLQAALADNQRLTEQIERQVEELLRQGELQAGLRRALRATLVLLWLQSRERQ